MVGSVTVIEVINHGKAVLNQEGDKLAVINTLPLTVRGTRWHVRLKQDQVNLVIKLGADLFHQVRKTALAVNQQGVHFQSQGTLNVIKLEYGHLDSDGLFRALRVVEGIPRRHKRRSAGHDPLQDMGMAIVRCQIRLEITPDCRVRLN